MYIFPNTSELVLAIFSALLTLAISLFIIKIQKSSDNSASKIEAGYKILLAKESQIKEFERSKLTSSKDARDAIVFIEHDFPVKFDEITERISKLDKRKKIVKPILFTSIGIIVLNMILITNLVENKSDHFTLTGVFLFFSLISGVGFLLLKKYKDDVTILRRKIDYLKDETIKAFDTIVQNS